MKTVLVSYSARHGWTYRVFNLGNADDMETVEASTGGNLKDVCPDLPTDDPHLLQTARDAVRRALETKFPGAKIELGPAPQNLR